MSKHGELTVWHLTMLALGTVIGGSFFLGSSIAIKTAGPGILISYLFGGLLVYIILTALSEMTVAKQSPGSFRTFAEQMYGPLVGFVIGWVYWTGLTLAMSSEATAVSVFLRTWIPNLSIPLMASLIIVGVTLLNLLGAKLLTTLESGLALIKISAIVGFIILAFAFITGLIPNKPALGLGELASEPLFPRGISGIAGSMLIVMFTYAGFEIIGLAAPEAKNPTYTIPRAIFYTVLGLVGLYSIAIIVLLPLVPTSELTEEVSPLIAGLQRVGLRWASGLMNAVLIIAILSTMLAAMFGMGRMVRSLAEKGYAPSWLKDKQDVPKRGILFSGVGMLVGVGLAYILPSEIYLFLVSSGGFSLLFAYVIIMATHFKFRRINGCPPKGNCQLFAYPYTTLFALVALIIIIISMPLIPGQGSGLFAGLILVAVYSISYMIIRARSLLKANKEISLKSIIGFDEIDPD
ncbi:amino acid permease [Vulcanibacillus modesticaldus]|uniref:Amino acid permease n=1 Tax=Vulcanibacillus modesticaldus TaxID=337097 RepID=A0A1D2YWA4_9BACI|nr:amino acid permease [Vulcanibacillus modesticaldus]OEF99963.1 amino acid permease [Vulcanibacillus modesticaldus]